jgi:hypothetical protein
MQKSKPSAIILCVGIVVLAIGCIFQNQSSTPPPTYQWQSALNDNFISMKGSEEYWMYVLGEDFSGLPTKGPAAFWSWSDTTGGILTIGNRMATVIGHVRGTSPLKGGTYPDAVQISMGFRLSSVDSNAAAVMLIDSTKRTEYRLSINRDSAGKIAPNVLIIACISIDSNKVISETHQTLTVKQQPTSNTPCQFVLTIDNSSATGTLQMGSLFGGVVRLDSSVIMASPPARSFSLAAGIDLEGTPTLPVYADSIYVQADYKKQGLNMWQWNDTSILWQDNTAMEIRSVGHADGALMQGGMRLNWPATSPVRVSMDAKFSSITANAAAVTVLDSVNNRRYWLIVGNNGVGQAAAGQLSAIATDGVNSRTIISQSHQTIPNLTANTYYRLVLTLDGSNVAGEIQQSGSAVAQTSIPSTTISANNIGMLFPAVELVGTSLSPVYARAFQVEIYKVVETGGGSCPFVYSFDGADWVFEAEPYGGAFTRGLQRTEWCVLEHCKEINGHYALRMTNELEETQFTDELKLVIVDHDSGVTIAPDASGGIHTIENPEAPCSARDAAGTDILPFVRKKDGRSWQSSLLSRATGTTTAARDTLEFEFRKPRAARTVKLLINTSTTLFGAEIGKRFLAMHGCLLSKWYDEIDKGGAALDQVHTWYQNEELYMLKAWVKTPDGWKARETILGSGPMASNDKVYIIDTRDIPGNMLRIRLCPPAGFWSFDYLAADFSADRQLSLHEAGATTARQNDGKDVCKAIGERDGSFLVSEKGSSVELSFAAPTLTHHTVRSVVLKANGWYRIHLDATGMPRFDLLARMNEPGFGAKFAIKEYLRLYKQTAMR